MNYGMYGNPDSQIQSTLMNGSAPAMTVDEPTFQSQEVLDQAIHYVEQANSMPLSASVLINREELLNLLYTAREQTPQEINYARKMLQERNHYMSKVRREAEEIIDRAKDKAAHLMQKTEIMKEAERNARRLLEEAQGKANHLRQETYKYCDSKLGRFENILGKVMQEVQTGRSKFQYDPLSKLTKSEPPQAPEGPSFYDQEQS